MVICAGFVPACSSKDETPPHDSAGTSSAGDRAAGSGCAAEADPGSGSAGLPATARWAVVCSGGNHTESVAAADLNGDGTADLVVQGSASRRASQGTMPHVLAIDGATGEQLWQSKDVVAMITLARFGDMNGDGIPDVLVNGRGAAIDERPLVALDGRDGKRLWRIEATDPSWRNIYTPQPAGDVNADGIGDWVISTGGDTIRAPLDVPTVRGEVAVVSGADGVVLGRVGLPEVQEIYASPVLLTDEGGSLSIIVGSGGEVFPGSLWRIRLDAVLQGDAAGFQRLLPGDDKSSYIAPVSVADLDHDGNVEVVAVRSDGLVTVVDPVSGAERWSTKVDASPPGTPETEMLTFSIAVPAIGQMDDDPALEIVVSSYAISRDNLIAGDMRKAPGSVTVLDGSTGSIEQRLRVRDGFSVSSPLLVTSSNGLAAVLCTCATSPATSGDEAASTGLGLWVPGRSDVEPIGVISEPNTTPTVVGVGGSFVVVTIGEAPQTDDGDATQISAVPVQLDGAPVASAPWAGYMGTAGTGHRDGN